MSLYLFWSIKLILYSPLIILFSIVLALSHHPLILKYLAIIIWIFEPLTVFLLVPGYLRPEQEPIFMRLTDDSSIKHLIFITGGNRSIPSETLNSLTGTLLTNGKRFSPIVESGEVLYVSPLLLQDDQKSYTKALSNKVLSFLKEYPEIDKISLIGHSIGGGLATQLALDLKRRPETKHIQLNLTVNRSFGNLWQAAKIKYSYYGGSILEKMFSVFWRFDNVKALKRLAKTDIRVSMTQVFPDYMFEPTCYLSSQIKNQDWLPSDWIIEEFHVKGDFLKKHEKELHSLPIIQLKELKI